jgi:hypothetical protein
LEKIASAQAIVLHCADRPKAQLSDVKNVVVLRLSLKGANWGKPGVNQRPQPQQSRQSELAR